MVLQKVGEFLTTISVNGNVQNSWNQSSGSTYDVSVSGQSQSVVETGSVTEEGDGHYDGDTENIGDFTGISSSINNYFNNFGSSYSIEVRVISANSGSSFELRKNGNTISSGSGSFYYSDSGSDFSAIDGNWTFYWSGQLTNDEETLEWDFSATLNGSTTVNGVNKS